MRSLPPAGQAGAAPSTIATAFPKAPDHLGSGCGSFDLLPEAFVGGYPKGIHFGARAGSRSAACVRLAAALAAKGITDEGVTHWLLTAPADPIPEVRYALSITPD
jgi:hypothetical protein